MTPCVTHYKEIIAQKTVFILTKIIAPVGTVQAKVGEKKESICLSSKMVQLKVDMQKVWIDHTIWTRSYIVSAISERGDQKDVLDRLLRNQQDISLVKSIPGIGDKLAAAIVAELGDESQFKDAKQIVAYAGLDPGNYSSGKFTATSNRITKRGSKRLRRALYLAVQ
ncbi:IS110 family transposase [Paenibacillus lautus]|uniref:IS110 family transposase n=1 Tax=Paenibacillus lautus TaxID=1401 RepID=UPI002DB7FBE9|nr:IS110 family transposase [Paenibacillus lautus]MEC0255166.1 IS110 family transposase [Paenibacillus lautus]